MYPLLRPLHWPVQYISSNAWGCLIWFDFCCGQWVKIEFRWTRTNHWLGQWVQKERFCYVPAPAQLLSFDLFRYCVRNVKTSVSTFTPNFLWSIFTIDRLVPNKMRSREREKMRKREKERKREREKERKREREKERKSIAKSRLDRWECLSFLTSLSHWLSLWTRFERW